MFFTKADQEEIEARIKFVEGMAEVDRRTAKQRADDLRGEISQDFGTAFRRLAELESAVVSLKSCREADLQDQLRRDKEQREFENRTIARLGDLESKQDAILNHADAIVESVADSVLGMILEILDSKSPRKVPNGKSKSGSGKKQRSR